MKRTWIVGTRGSKLALVQTGMVIDGLRALYPDCDFTVKTIKTTGDSVWNTPLYLIGQKGLFIKEIEEALAKGEIDLAVHSIKDLPTELLPGLALSSVLEREDPRDTFISLMHDRLADMPKGSRIGTSSMRRRAQLLAFRPDIEILPLRGNVDTRVKKLDGQNLDGLILAYAGVKRMGLQHRVKEVLPFDVMVPACGQGAIGIETRVAGEAADLVSSLNHDPSGFEVGLERAFQAAVGGGCSLPLGVNAHLSGNRVTLRAVYGDENGALLFKESAEGERTEGDMLAKRLLAGLDNARGCRVV
ncbi:MAG: hydroxymethylbilane synthase [Syntrophorhabdales bacterium]|jgi:hydroxymethylbilane synthase